MTDDDAATPELSQYRRVRAWTAKPVPGKIFGVALVRAAMADDGAFRAGEGMSRRGSCTSRRNWDSVVQLPSLAELGTAGPEQPVTMRRITRVICNAW